jgi:hypothetical protein
MTAPIGIRWTIGDVAPEGFDALRLSIHGAWKIFGTGADYAVCVNLISPELARADTGELPCRVRWHDSTQEVPDFLKPHLKRGMAEGAGWKFAPLRLFPHRHELSLDNDCILWELPPTVARWLDEPSGERCLTAEDVAPGFGKFSDLCGPAPRNGGLRGFPPGYDFGHSVSEILGQRPVQLESELDEQGLQTAALTRSGNPFVVRLDEVTICSPFPPHLPRLGSCGAHFCGLNARELPWKLDGRPASGFVREHWQRHRASVAAKVGVSESGQRGRRTTPPQFVASSIGGAKTEPTGLEPATSAVTGQRSNQLS